MDRLICNSLFNKWFKEISKTTQWSFKLVATMQSFTCVRCKYESKLNYGVLKKWSSSTQFPAFAEGYIFVVCWCTFTKNSEGNQTVLESLTEKGSILSSTYYRFILPTSLSENNKLILIHKNTTDDQLTWELLTCSCLYFCTKA